MFHEHDEDRRHKQTRSLLSVHVRTSIPNISAVPRVSIQQSPAIAEHQCVGKETTIRRNTACCRVRRSSSTVQAQQQVFDIHTPIAIFLVVAGSGSTLTPSGARRSFPWHLHMARVAIRILAGLRCTCRNLVRSG